MGSDARRIHLGDGVRLVVLRALGAADQRAIAAGHREDELVVRPVEGGRQFRTVLHRDAARRAGTGIDEPSARLQSVGGVLGRARDGGEDRAHGGDGGKLALVHGLDGVERGPSVEVDIAGADVFGGHGVSSCG